MRNDRNRTSSLWIKISVAAVALAMLASAALSTQQPSGMAVNEAEAIATLRSIAAAQAQLEAAVAIDTDCDGVGEYGFFAELAGIQPMRVGIFAGRGCVPAAGWNNFLTPPLLRSPFGMVMDSCVTHQGYVFEMWLAQPIVGVKVAGVREDMTGGKLAAPFPDPITGARLWCCYAWPLSYNHTGRGAYVINQEGRVLRCANRSLSPFTGQTMTPGFDEAFVLAGAINSPLRIGIPGGNTHSIWWPVR